jgi:hypothetical protein
MPPKRRQVQATGPLCFRRPRLLLQLDSFADWLDKRGAAAPNREPLMDQVANLRQAVLALDMPRRRGRCVTVVPLATMVRKQQALRKALRELQEKFCAFKGAKDQHRAQLNTFVRVALADPALSERRLEELARRWTLDEEEEVVVGRNTIGSIRNGLVEFLVRRQRENLSNRIKQYSATHRGAVHVLVLHVHDEALLRLKSYTAEPGGLNRPRARSTPVFNAVVSVAVGYQTGGLTPYLLELVPLASKTAQNLATALEVQLQERVSARFWGFG